MDPVRKFATPEPNNRNNWTCNFCQKVTKGGVYRAKQHIVGGSRNVVKCLQCPQHVREEIEEYMKAKEKKKLESQMMSVPFQDLDGEEGDDEDDELKVMGQRSAPKRPRQKGPMDMYLHVNPKPKSELKGKNAEAREAMDKKLRAKA